MKKFIVLALGALFLVSCGGAKGAKDAEKEVKYLVLYYSQTGVTRQLAGILTDLLGADSASFDVEERYAGTFDETVERCLAEQRTGTLSPLRPLKVNPDDYDVIFLGYPVWFGTYARPVMSLLKERSFEGKTVVPFCTFGSGGLESSTDSLRAACPGAAVTDGYGVREARIGRAAEEAKQFLVDGGYLQGSPSPAEDYGEESRVGPEERAIFNEACGDYKMPVGEPMTMRARFTEDAAYYVFTAASKTPDGRRTTSLVYITLPNGGKAEMVKVKR